MKDIQAKEEASSPQKEKISLLQNNFFTFLFCGSFSPTCRWILIRITYRSGSGRQKSFQNRIRNAGKKSWQKTFVILYYCLACIFKTFPVEVTCSLRCKL